VTYRRVFIVGVNMKTDANIYHVTWNDIATFFEWSCNRSASRDRHAVVPLSC